MKNKKQLIVSIAETEESQYNAEYYNREYFDNNAKIVRIGESKNERSFLAANVIDNQEIFKETLRYVDENQPNNYLIFVFKDNDNIDINDFTNEVITEPDIIEKFHHYKQRCEDENGISIDSQFAISDAARKKQQRAYKRVIRLDKKIQIVIDGNTQNVEQGKDAPGKFYKDVL